MRMDWAIAFTSSDAIDRESDVNAHYVWRMHARDTGIGGNAIDQRLRRACGPYRTLFHPSLGQDVAKI